MIIPGKPDSWKEHGRVPHICAVFADVGFPKAFGRRSNFLYADMTSLLTLKIANNQHPFDCGHDPLLVLYQGMTLVVPYRPENFVGL